MTMYVPHVCKYCGKEKRTAEALIRHVAKCPKRWSQTGKRPKRRPER